MPEVIELQDVVTTMLKLDRNKPKVFSIEFVTANKRTGEGGDVIKFDKAVVTYTNPSGTRKLDVSTQAKKVSNHRANGTINIQQVGSPVITKVHLFLIRKFNGLKMVLSIHG